MEQSIKQKLAIGAGIFSRQEVEFLLEALKVARKGRERYKGRFHSVFGPPFAYHHPEVGFQIICGLPIPEGSRKLYLKPENIKIDRNWRMKPGTLQKGAHVNSIGNVCVKFQSHPRRAAAYFAALASRIRNEYRDHYYANLAEGRSEVSPTGIGGCPDCEVLDGEGPRVQYHDARTSLNTGLDGRPGRDLDGDNLSEVSEVDLPISGNP